MSARPYSFFEAALAYATRYKLPVFPLVPREKRPLTDNGHLDATTDPATIALWGAKWPEANVGLPTGRRIEAVVLDIDPRHGGDVTLEELQAEHGCLPDTVECLTGGGGRHLYFSQPGGYIKSRAEALGPGVDVRADGGYVVAPPSIHPNGRRYAWEGAHRPGEVPLAPMPPWLTKALREPISGDPSLARSVEYWRLVAAEGVTEGKRNDTATQFAGYLLRRYVDPVVCLDLLASWNRTRCRPPMPDEEVAAIVESVTKSEMLRRVLRKAREENNHG